MHESGLYGRVSSVWKSVGCVEESRLCGIEWVMWNSVVCVE